MGICDERTGATVEVSKIVPENMYRCFSLRQGSEAHAVHIELHCAWTKTQFETEGLGVGFFLDMKRYGLRRIPTVQL